MTYAPAREDGRKPYTVTVSDWGQQRTRVVYAKDSMDARRQVIGRGQVGLYLVSCKRTRVEEVE